MLGYTANDFQITAARWRAAVANVRAISVDGAFVCTFVDPIAPYSENAQYDLDMSALSLVKTYEASHGTTYPDMTWEPKESFKAVAAYYGN